MVESELDRIRFKCYVIIHSREQALVLVQIQSNDTRYLAGLVDVLAPGTDSQPHEVGLDRELLPELLQRGKCVERDNISRLGKGMLDFDTV